jgi:phospholipase D1/2
LKDLKQDLFNGIDYSNSRIKDFANVQDWKNDQLDRKTQTRMPWHDVALMIKGNSAYDVSVNFIELWNHVMTDFYGWYNSNKKDLLTPFLTGKVSRLIDSELSVNVSSVNESFSSYTENEEIERKRNKTMDERKSITLGMAEEVKAQEYQLKRSFKKVANEGTCDCQIVRSAGLWSYGLRQTDCSIQTAYINLIQEAKHFIYIENQFFISSTAGAPVENKIAQALVDKIIEKHKNNEKFKIIVVLPLLPGFAGEADSSGLLRIQLHWEFQTICRSESSIFSQLSKAGIEPEDFIRFYGLRNHALLESVPVTEIVYVHSKYMIIDDNKLIIGSANINDRSMTGLHDSEIAVVVEDRLKVDVFFHGVKNQASKVVHDMRIKIFKEFSGEKDAKVLADPFSNEFYKEWEGNAQNNTLKYRDVFGCYPDDTIKRNSDLERVKVKIPSSKKYNMEKDQIKGFLVQYPLEFLKEEDLTFKLTDVERIIPMKSFI